MLQPKTATPAAGNDPSLSRKSYAAASATIGTSTPAPQAAVD